MIEEKKISDKANKSKSDFLSHMSHELRTPLNAVLGFSQLLAAEDDEETKDYANEIMKAGGHLLSLVNDILDLSKIEAGKLDFSIEDISWNTVIEECYVLLENIADEKSININLNFDENIEYIVKADRVRLKQSTLNLMSNAIKYNMDSGTVTISFDLENDILRMSVKDMGKGIAIEQQEKLFTPFQRLDMGKSAVDGVGIGLVITKSLIESMQGNIGFKSEVGLGSVFWIEFPIERIDKYTENIEHNSDVDLLPKNTEQDVMLDGESIDILYIEDNLSNMKVVEKCLKKYSNINFYPACAPSEGMELLTTLTPDIILLDINLPEMDGFEFKELLNQNKKHKDIKVIGISANVMPADIEKSKSYHFFDYLPKPVEINIMIQRIEAALTY